MEPYSEIPPPREIDILPWRNQAITSHVDSTVEIKPKFPEYVIYTDAATSTRIAAALVFKKEVPSGHPIIGELREEASPPPTFGRQPSTAQLTFMDWGGSPSWAFSYP